MTSQAADSQDERQYRRASDRWKAVYARIELHASLLADQGDLVLKPMDAKRYWYLRFLLPADERGHRRHRSLYVGRECDLEIVARVRVLLECYRQPRRQVEEIAGYVRLVRTSSRGVRAAARRLGA